MLTQGVRLPVVGVAIDVQCIRVIGTADGASGGATDEATPVRLSGRVWLTHAAWAEVHEGSRVSRGRASLLVDGTATVPMGAV